MYQVATQPLPFGGPQHLRAGGKVKSGPQLGLAVQGLQPEQFGHPRVTIELSKRGALNCFNCGRSGHWSQDCPNFSKGQVGGRLKKGGPPTLPGLLAHSGPRGLCVVVTVAIKSVFQGAADVSALFDCWRYAFCTKPVLSNEH